MSWTPAQGDTIAGKYRLERELGQGGIAKVWLSSNDGFEYAIKHPNLGSGNDPSVIQSYFIQELETLKEIDAAGGHPNIMGFVEDPTERGIQFIATELVVGKELLEIVEEEGSMDPDEVRRIGIDLCQALSFLHENEIIYRDLKPDNVMLEANHTPKLIDFNTAKVWEQTDAKCPKCRHPVDPGDLKCANCGNRLPLDSQIGGGGGFKPIEIADAQRHRDLEQGPWSDVYSIGKTLVYMLVGSAPPQDGVDPRDMGVSCPDYLAEAIKRSTERDYNARYRNATVLGWVLANEDPDPKAFGRLKRIQSNRTYDIHPGDTLGRDGADGPPASIRITDPQGGYISAVQVRFDTDSNGRWVLHDKSLNGTFVNKGNGWEKVLCIDGRERLREKGHDPTDRNGNVPPESIHLDAGDTIALVDPSYGVTFEFEPVI